MKLHHIALNTVKFEETITFYKALFGMDEVRRWDMGGKLGCMLMIKGGGMLEIFGVADGEEGDGKFNHIAFESDNVDTDYKKALSLGATSDMEPIDITIPSNPPAPLRIAFVRGFAGERIEFVTENK